MGTAGRLNENGVLGRRTHHEDNEAGLEWREVKSTSMTKGVIWTEGPDWLE